MGDTPVLSAFKKNRAVGLLVMKNRFRDQVLQYLLMGADGLVLDGEDFGVE